MPQHRATLADDARLRVERVRAHAARAGWSAVYVTPSARLVLPGTGAVQVRSGSSDVLADPLTAFCLASAASYQLQSCGPEAVRTSVVVSEGGGAAWLPGPAAWLLDPHALYQLRLQWRLLERGDGDVVQVARLIARVLATSASAGRGESDAVRRARRLLVSQPWGRQPLAAIAEAAGCSPFHLARAFRAQTGLGLHQYRQSLRMAAALARLQDGERDLAGLAHELGFSSQSHLGAVFQRAVGVTPAQARSQLAH